jgi:hypothetical protein
MQAGPNRISDVHLVEPQVCVCEGIRLRIEGIRFEQREREANGMGLGHQRIANC